MGASGTVMRKNLIRLAVLAGIVVAVYLVFRFTALSPSDLSPTKIKNFILRFGIWGPFVFIGIYALRAAVLVIPVGFMSLAGGLAYGKWLGTVYILIGATLGSCLAFLIARYLGRGFIEQFDWLHKGRIKQFDEGSAKRVMSRFAHTTPSHPESVLTGHWSAAPREYLVSYYCASESSIPRSEAGKRL